VKRLRSISIGRLARRGVALATVGIALTACGSWRGIANVPIPGGRGTGAGHMTIYAQMPDTLALYVNSQVRVADVSVGTVSYLLLPFSLSPQKGAAASVYQQPRRFEGGRASPVVRRRALCPAL